MNDKLLSPFFDNTLIQQARTWLGTPFHHQGRLKGIGCDCLGFVVGVASELQLKDQQGNPLIFHDEVDYSKHPDGQYLMQKLQSVLEEIPIEQMQEGDLALFDVRGNPQHMGLITTLKGEFGLLHAHAPSRRVVEHNFDDFWKQRLRKVYRWQQWFSRKPQAMGLPN